MMTIQWRDVTIPMRPGMTPWPGDPIFEFEPVARIAEGHTCNLSRISMCTHTGTHLDAPWHFDDNGLKIHEIDQSLFFGEALLVDALDENEVSMETLGPSPLPERIVVRTRSSEFSDEPGAPFRTDFVGISAEAARRVVNEGTRLVGVDYLSVAPYKQKNHETHRILLENGVVVVEGLRLKGLPKGSCLFTMLPLNIVASDGAPCRAFVGYEEYRG
jgi:arylformamidase